MSHICGSKTRPPTDRVTSPYGTHMGLTYQFSISYHISRHSTSCHTHPNQLISNANPLATQALQSRSRLCENSHYEIPLIWNFYNEEQTLRWGRHSPSKPLIRNFRNKINVPEFLRSRETKTKSWKHLIFCTDIYRKHLFQFSRTLTANVKTQLFMLLPRLVSGTRIVDFQVFGKFPSFWNVIPKL